MVPSPWTGGGGKIAIIAFWMAAYFCCSFCAIAMPERSDEVRWSNGFNVTNTMPADGLLMKAVDRKPGERDGICNARLRERDGRHLADHGFRPVERRAFRQLREADEILLVLHRHEARRHHLETDIGEADENGIDDQGPRLAGEKPGNTVAIALRTGVEQIVEAAEEAAQYAVHAPRQPVFRRIVRFEKRRRERRRQGQRVEGRDDRRKRDGERELAGRTRRSGR